MIEVKQLSDEEWEVTVASQTITKHRVHLAAAEVERLGHGKADAKELLEASFRFLLQREPNTSILSSFELSEIGRYFPEYEREIMSRYRPA